MSLYRPVNNETLLSRSLLKDCTSKLEVNGRRRVSWRLSEVMIVAPNHAVLWRLH
jgi:hypothetical protein